MKKIIMVVVMIALFAGAVGVGVHVLNKEAMAGENHVVWVIQDGFGAVENVEVTIYVKTGPNPEDWESDVGRTDEDGKYAWNATPHSTASYWKAEITDPNGLDVMEPENPTTITYMTLAVTFTLGDNN